MMLHLLLRYPLNRVLLLTTLAAGMARADGTYYAVNYSASTLADELQLAVTYTLWLPAGPAPVRAVIVHQHGCGFAANAAGDAAAYDLHWQALARKQHCGLLSPRYRQTAQGREPCELWMDPRRGSRQRFLQALEDLASKSHRPELRSTPWCLWGHSGGAYWSSLMQLSDPDRIVAAWLRSGTAFPAWESGLIPPVTVTAKTLQIPTMLNPGIKEQPDPRPIAAWMGSMAMFNHYRAQGGLIGFVADPKSGHDCGDSRYLAIPYLDACLARRLPAAPGEPLRTMDPQAVWLAPVQSAVIKPVDQYAGEMEASVWLPTAAVAQCYADFVTTGAIHDDTPPPAPTQVVVRPMPNNTVEITWDAGADFESGLAGFDILRDGKVIAELPQHPVGKFGRPLFQTLSDHDTPELPLPMFRFIDVDLLPNARPVYGIAAINGAGRRSAITSAK